MDSRTIDVDAPPMNPQPKIARPRRSLLLFNYSSPDHENELHVSASLSSEQNFLLRSFLSFVIASACLVAPFLLKRFLSPALFSSEADFLHKIMFAFSGVSMACLLHAFAECIIFRRRFGIFPSFRDLDFYDYDRFLKKAVVPTFLATFVLFVALYIGFFMKIF